MLFKLTVRCAILLGQIRYLVDKFLDH